MKNKISHTSESTVTEQKTARVMGSGDLPVLATPALVALMENAAMLAAAKLCKPEETTVGASINIKHLQPSPIGVNIMAEAILVENEGRKLTFNITAVQDNTIIGTAVHIRYIVNSNTFMNKIQPK